MEPEKVNAAKATILVVDDTPMIVRLVRDLLEPQNYACEVAMNTQQARELLAEKEFDLILTDVNMPPGDSGLELVRDVVRDHPDTATIIVTAIDNPDTSTLALEMGAYGYVIKPFNNNELLINVTNALIRRKLTIENRNNQTKLEREVVGRTKELMKAIQQLESTQKHLRRSQEETIQRLAKAAEFRDNETAQHIRRMSNYCELLGQKLGLDDDRVELLRMASPMHDIGKIGTHDSILLKDGQHTEEEFEIMKQHAEIGFRILSGSDSELLNLGAIIAWTHHEKFDGTGYPRGLAGEDIPLEGRITAVSDVFDALTSKRVYKPAFTVEESIGLMKEQRGKHFDPDLLDLFLESMPHVLVIKERFADTD
jgi:putative two-component system response regulator